jgi:hypothetical protein
MEWAEPLALPSTPQQMHQLLAGDNVIRSLTLSSTLNLHVSGRPLRHASQFERLHLSLIIEVTQGQLIHLGLLRPHRRSQHPRRCPRCKYDPLPSTHLSPSKPRRFVVPTSLLFTHLPAPITCKGLFPFHWRNLLSPGIHGQMTLEPFHRLHRPPRLVLVLYNTSIPSSLFLRVSERPCSYL